MIKFYHSHNAQAVLDELTELNRSYREKHGFVFLVCASGKPANEILALLKARLPNNRETEVLCSGTSICNSTGHFPLESESDRSVIAKNSILARRCWVYSVRVDRRGTAFIAEQKWG